MCNGSGRFLAKNGWSVFKTEQGVRYRTPSEEGLLLDINCLSFWHGCCFRKSAMIDKIWIEKYQKKYEEEYAIRGLYVMEVLESGA